MILGVTGTQRGWTEQQHTAFRHLVGKVLRPTRFHHGTCMGVDSQAAWCIWHLFNEHHREQAPVPCFIIGHPSTLIEKRGDFNKDNHAVWAKLPLERNKDIVHHVELLVVIPKEDAEVLRSGTWATYRAAQRLKKPWLIIWPDGRVTWEGKAERCKITARPVKTWLKQRDLLSI